MIANICNGANKSNVIGYRLMNTETSEVIDVPTEQVKATMAKGTVTFENIANIGNIITGTNGILTRYPYIDLKTKNLVGAQYSPFIVLKRLGDAGYVVVDGFGKTAKVRVDKAVEYAKSFGIANGKVVEKDGIEFISSISGNYEVEEVRASTHKNTRGGGIAIPMGPDASTEVAKNAAAGIEYEVAANDVFKCMSPQQKNLLKSYYMWYTVKVYKQLAKNLRLDISPTKVAKLAEIRSDEKWQFAGVWDTGFAGGGHCELGHALRYEYYAEPISDESSENKARWYGMNRNTHTSLSQGGNCIIFGERCAGDFFNISPEDMKKLVKTREIMSQEIEWIVEAVTNKYEQMLFDRVKLLVDIVKRLVEIDKVNVIFGPTIGFMLVQFLAANIPYPMSLVLMAADEFRKNIDENFETVFPSKEYTKQIIGNTEIVDGYRLGHNAMSLKELFNYVKEYQIEGAYMYNPLDEKTVKRKDKGGYNEKARKERRSTLYFMKHGNYGSCGEKMEELNCLFTLSEFYASTLQKVRELLDDEWAQCPAVREIIERIKAELESEYKYKVSTAEGIIKRAKMAAPMWKNLTSNKEMAEYALSICSSSFAKQHMESLRQLNNGANNEEIELNYNRFMVALNMFRYTIYKMGDITTSFYMIPNNDDGASRYRNYFNMKECLENIETTFESSPDKAAVFFVKCLEDSLKSHNEELEEKERIKQELAEEANKTYAVIGYDKDNDIYTVIEAGIQDKKDAIQIGITNSVKMIVDVTRNEVGEPIDWISVYEGWDTESEKQIWCTPDSQEEIDNLVKIIEEQREKAKVQNSIKEETEKEVKEQKESSDELSELRKLLEEKRGTYDEEDYGFKIALDIAGRSYNKMSDLSSKQQWRVKDTLNKLRDNEKDEEETPEATEVAYGIEFENGRATVKGNEKLEKMTKVIEKYRNDTEVKAAVNGVSDKAYAILDTVSKKGYLSPKQMRHLDIAYNKTVEIILLK